jgi:hypothetical protein
MSIMLWYRSMSSTNRFAPNPIPSSNRRALTLVVYSRTSSHPNESGAYHGQFFSKEKMTTKKGATDVGEFTQ